MAHERSHPHTASYQGTLDDAKDNMEETSGLRPTNEKLLGPKSPTRPKDYTRSMLMGKIKCGPYWNHIPG